jgi:aquaporin Z
MRVMPIRIVTGQNGTTQLKASFQKNYKHYLQEALGLAIFMMSACFFGALLESPASPVHQLLQNSFLRLVMMGVLMGATALFIFYWPFTAASGAQINPAVTLSFLRTGQMCKYDALFFMLFQITGGTLAVYMMQQLMGSWLIDAPVNSVVTVPGEAGVAPAAFTEFIIAFITMSMVMFTSQHNVLKKYTRIIAACLVCCWVIFAGPVSGFGMNPARSFASALPANTWTAFPIYIIAPFAGMLSATELFLQFRKTRIVTN